MYKTKAQKIMALDEDRFPEDVLAEASEEASTASDEPTNEFDGLDLRKASCFGYSFPKASSWTNLAEVALDKGWENIDADKLQDSLMHNIEKCYYKIAQFKLSNVNDDMKYSLWFDNNKGLWDLAISNSPKAELTVEQRAGFFKSEMFKKIAKRTYFIITEAKKTYDKIVKFHIENGELLDVDVVKLDAILHFIGMQYFLDNILAGKYFSF